MKINDKREFEQFYPYDTKYIKEYPKEYPCYCKVEVRDGGIVGDWKQVYVAYIPKVTSIEEAFVKGLQYKWKPIK